MKTLGEKLMTKSCSAETCAPAYVVFWRPVWIQWDLIRLVGVWKIISCQAGGPKSWAGQSGHNMNKLQSRRFTGRFCWSTRYYKPALTSLSWSFVLMLSGFHQLQSCSSVNLTNQAHLHNFPLSQSQKHPDASKSHLLQTHSFPSPAQKTFYKVV